MNAQSTPAPKKWTYPDFTPEEAQEKPWKYVGYRVFAKWLASDDRFCIVRKFGGLNMRAILYLQDELVSLEDDLRKRDEINSKKAMPDEMHNGTFRNEDDDERKRIVNKAVDKLERYNKFVNQYATLVSRGGVPKVDQRNVQEWLKWHRVQFTDGRMGFAIDPSEADFIHRKDDLIAIHPITRSWIRNISEWIALHWNLRSRLYRRTPEDIEMIATSIGDQDVTMWADDELIRRIEDLSTAVIAMVGLVMIIAPLWILEFVTKPVLELAIITIFVVVLFILISVATTVRVYELIGAVAAYAALLMVFMQLSSTSH